MKIERIELFPVKLPLKAVLTLPRGASRTLAEGKQIVLVKMTADDGTVGWGEAGPSRRWSAETTWSTWSSIRHYLAPVVIGRDPFDIAGIHAAMNNELAPGLDPGQPIAKAAIDMALHDMIGKKLGIPVQAWFGSRLADGVDLSCLVSAADVDGIVEVTRKGLEQGFAAFKVKVGTDPALDVAKVKAVMETAPGAIVWPDANQGYDLAGAMRAARGFEALGVELFEQPIPMGDVYGMRKLLRSTGMTIALDEGAVGLPFVIELIRREAVDGIVVKVNKVGGLHYARQLCDLARNAGFRLIGSGLMDAPLGFAASVHLFAAHGIDFPVDLNGPQHLADDYLAAPLPRRGQRALVPDAPGLGVEIDEDKVKALALAMD